MIKRILILCTVLCMTNMMAFAQAKSVDKGQRGHHVQKIQTMLVHQGYLNDSADGIFGAMFGMIKLGIVPMPAEANWKFIYGTSIVCGIGFTMSIFVSVLAYDPGHAQEMAKGGVLIGSIISAIIGYGYLRIVGAKRKECHIGVYHNC